MKVPLLLHLGALAEAAPLVVAAVVRRPLRAARAWVLVWCAVLVLVDAAQLWLGSRGVRNLWLIYVLTPLSGSVVLWALSHWQSSELARLTLRLAIVPFLLVWAVLTLALEDTSTFSRAAEPMANLVGLGAAAYTLLARSLRSGGEMLREDWFWVSAGMALYFGTSSAVGPLSVLLVGGDPLLMVQAYEVKSVLLIAAFLAISRGMACRPST